MQLLTLNNPNKNNHIYSDDVILDAINECAAKKQELLLYEDLKHDPTEEHIGKVIDLSIEENMLVGKVVISDEYKTKACVEDLDFVGNYHVRPTGMGLIDDDGRVTDFSFKHFVITDDPA